MKKIHSYLLAVVTLLAFAPCLTAQDYTVKGVIGYNPVFPEESDFGTDKSMGLKKDISRPVNGQYWLKLEAYAEGEGIATDESTPSDVILVLDLSSSMSRFHYINSKTEYKAFPSYSYSYDNYYDDRLSSYTGDREEHYFYLYNGKYYLVDRGGNNQQGYYLYFEDESETTHYLSGTGVTETRPTGVTSQNSTIWTGVLYHATRLDALIDATKEFLGTIYENDQKASAEAAQVGATYPGNRVAIVTYSGSSAINVVSDWVYIKDAIQKTGDTYTGDIIDSIEGFRGSSGTRPDLGLSEVIDELMPERREDASLSVLLFTDGYPVQSQDTAGEGSSSERFTWIHANNTIWYSHILKDTYDATLYTVGLLTEVEPATSWQYRNYKRVLYLLDLVSSNYPDAAITPQNNSNEWQIANNGEGAITVTGLTTEPRGKTESKYFQLVDENTNLSDIFKTIAGESGGSPATGMNHQSGAVDIVSSSFVLPDNVDESGIYVFTAPYVYDTESGEYSWGTETLAPYSEDTYIDYEVNADGTKTLVDPDHPSADVDGTVDNPRITVTLAENNRKVSVNGFDYADNWCGPVYSDETKTTIVRAHGHKIMIFIPIQMNPDAIGGPNVATNAAGSGLVDKDGNLYVKFDPPHVDLPINVHVKTTGLDKGESAKYSLWKKGASDTDWTYVTSFFVTRHKDDESDDPITKLVGLASNSTSGLVTFKVTPEAWDWTYSLDSVEGIGPATDAYPMGAPFTIDKETLADPDTEITTDLFLVNPIIFNNSKTDGIAPKVRYSESKATNTFGTNYGVGYDDYKTNTKDGRAAKLIPKTEKTK